MVCAVAAEAEPLQKSLTDAAPTQVGRRPATAGFLGDQPVVVIPTGMGKTNAAQTLTALLESRPVRGVIAFGIAGAYAGSGLDVGDVALASAAVYGDEGVQTPDGWIGTDGIGIPLLAQGPETFFNTFPLEAARIAAAEQALAAAGIAVRTGSFLTVSCCAGTAQLGAERAARWGAICEDMETAALAHVAMLYDVPLLAVRGVSNAVEDRDPSRWRIAEASHAACEAVGTLVHTWTD